MKTSMIWGALALCLGTGFAQEDYTTWGRVKTLTLNTSSTGANLTENTGNFPLLVRLDSTHAEVFQQSKTGGADLRFRRVTGPQLPYYIASWDSAARKAEIWVSVDTVFANNANQFIRMYWQKASATAASSAAGVFSPAKGFVAAWNMGGATGARANYVTGGVTARPTNDRTGGTYTGRSVPGVIGTADSLAGGVGLNDAGGLGGGEHFDVAPMPTFEGGFTLSMWANVTSTTNRTWMRFFDFGNGEAADNIFAGRVGTETNVRFDVLPTGLPVAGAIVLNQWKHFTFTADAAGMMNAFLDGVSAGTMEGGMISPAERASSFLGKSNWPGDAYFTGLMDEVQVSGTGRSPAWAKLAYATQRPGANLLTWSTSGPGSSVLPGVAARSLRIRRQGANYVFELPSAGSEARLTVTDMSGRRVWSRSIGRTETRVAWNGANASGSAAARGTYVARLEVLNGNAPAWEGTIAHVR